MEADSGQSNDQPSVGSRVLAKRLWTEDNQSGFGSGSLTQGVLRTPSPLPDLVTRPQSTAQSPLAISFAIACPSKGIVPKSLWDTWWVHHAHINSSLSLDVDKEKFDRVKLLACMHTMEV